MARGGRFDVVFYGHDHRHRIARHGSCQLINPGEIMGRLGRGTFVLFDTETRRAETVEM